MTEKKIIVEVAYALPNEQLMISIKVSEGTTANQAIQISGILSRFPEIDLDVNKVGIFGKLITLDTLLRNFERIEIYRKLSADPKLIRKQRAQGAKNIKKAAKSLPKT